MADDDPPEVRSNKQVRDADPLPIPPPVTADNATVREAIKFHLQYQGDWQKYYIIQPDIAAQAQKQQQKKK